MVDRGGNYEGGGWPPGVRGSGPAYPPSSASSSSSAHGRSSASFNSDHQVFMQQLQNFSHNFAHVTNGYPPTQYGHHPMPAHAAQGPQQQQSLRVVPSSHPGYGVAPLPAHMRSYNPSYAHRPQQPQVPNYPPAAYAAQHYPTTNLAQVGQHHYHPTNHSAHTGNSQQTSGNPQPKAHTHHPSYQQQHQQHHPHQQHPNNGGGGGGGGSYYVYPQQQHIHSPQTTPNNNLPYESPMNLTPGLKGERTILNTPSYPNAHPSPKPETISVPTCIPIPQHIPQSTPMPIHSLTNTSSSSLHQTSVSWKRKANGDLSPAAACLETPPKRPRIMHPTQQQQKENNAAKEKEDSSLIPPIQHQHPPPPPTNTTATAALAPVDPPPKPRKKKESLKEVQQRVLQEQQQIMRGGAAAVVVSPSHPAIESTLNGASPPPTPHYYTPNSPSYPPPPLPSPQPTHPPPKNHSTSAATAAAPSNNNNIPPPVSAVSTPSTNSTPSSSQNNILSNSGNSNGCGLPLKKGGTLWALPILPKLPQKPSKENALKKPLNQPPPPTNAASFKDVWLSAFGASNNNKKPSKSEPPSSPSVSAPSASKPPSSPGAVKKAHKTYLDIPPELRRRPRPEYGGIIHFAPHWEKSVGDYHLKCRIPEKIRLRMSSVSPRILLKNASTKNPEEEDHSSPSPSTSKGDAPQQPPLFENSNPEDDLSPQRSNHPSSMTSPFSRTAEAPRAVNHVVDSVLENRKILRTTNVQRLYKKPRWKSNSYSEDEEGESSGAALMHTPGLAREGNGEEALACHHYFRRETLLRYLDETKILDWKPEVFETKTRRQSHQVRAVTAYREIFGIDLPERFTNGKSSSPVKKKKRPYVKRTPPFTPKKEEPEDIKVEEKNTEEIHHSPPPKKGEEEEQEEEEDRLKKDPSPPPPPKKAIEVVASPKKAAEVVAPPKKAAEVVDPPKKEEEKESSGNSDEDLQSELTSFALHLLESNPSWNEKVVIQNLVIWEPLDPLPVQPKPKKTYYHRKARKRKSGLDFSRSKSKSNKAVKEESKDSLPVQDVLYTLDQIIAESKSWVIDKGAGETILHRASKMGYTDVVAYALDMLKIPPSIKDNAGIPPIHKAAFRGHGLIVDILLRYGEDPNTNVKGTRPLHEALEGGDPLAVHALLNHGADPLLYDYSGNMPIDLTEEDLDMRKYLGGILSDLHGKTAPRWNVVSRGSRNSFSTPPQELTQECDEDESLSLEFECSSSPLPPYYQFKDREGQFVKASDLPAYLLKGATLLEMTKEEFLRNSHCTLLGGGSSPTEKDSKNVRLLRLDESLRKALGISIETLS